MAAFTIVSGLSAADDNSDKITAGVETSLAQRSTLESKIAYLGSVIAVEDSTDTGNIRKSFAIATLGKIGGTNVLDILLANVEFKENATGGSPACGALVKIGSPAIPCILKNIESTPATNSPRLFRLAEAVRDIKKERFAKYLETQNEDLSKEGWEKLKSHSVIVTDG